MLVVFQEIDLLIIELGHDLRLVRIPVMVHGKWPLALTTVMKIGEYGLCARVNGPNNRHVYETNLDFFVKPEGFVISYQDRLTEKPRRLAKAL